VENCGLNRILFRVVTGEWDRMRDGCIKWGLHPPRGREVLECQFVSMGFAIASPTEKYIRFV